MADEKEIPIPPLVGAFGPIVQPLEIIGGKAKFESPEAVDEELEDKPTFDINIVCDKCGKELRSVELARCPHCGAVLKA